MKQNYVTELSLEEVKNEKKRIKAIIRDFERDFNNKNKRNPTAYEKEHSPIGKLYL